MTLYVEGIAAAGTAAITVTITSAREWLTENEPISDTDTVLVTVVDVTLDLDVDSDNNGYINTAANAGRMRAEDAMEESTAKPITYFGAVVAATGVARYIPIHLSLVTTIPGAKFSLHYTDNLVVYKAAVASS